MKHLLITVALLLAALVTATPGARADDRLRGMVVPPSLDENDIVELAAFRPNVVRYQLIWNDKEVNAANREQYLAWLAGALATFDQQLPVYTANHMTVILDLHSPPGGLISKRAPQRHRMFTEAWAQSTFLEVCELLATRYKNNSAVWAFDIVNEPAHTKVGAGLLNWNNLARQAALRIREIDPNRRIIIESLYGDQSRIRTLTTLLDLANIVYSAHMYFPLRFQHQGLYGNPLGVKYPKGKFNKRSLVQNLAKIRKFQQLHGVQVYIGEFSAVRWAPGNSSFLYLRDLIGIFEKYGWDWTYHAWRESDAWSVEHGGKKKVHTPSPVKTDRAKLLEQLFLKNTLS